MLSAYTKLISKIEKLLEILVIVFLFLAFCVIFLQVLTRYCFNGSAPWMEESGRYMIIWMSFLGSVIGMRHRRHMYVDVFEERMPPKVRYLLNLALDALLLVFLCILFRSSLIYMLANTTNISPGVPISMSWVYLSCVVGSALMILFELELLFLRIKTRQCHPETAVMKEDGGTEP